MEDRFIVAMWPNVQDLMGEVGFEENSLLINDGKLYEEYGDSAYMIRESWFNSLNNRV